MTLAHDAATRWPASFTDSTSGNRTFTHTPAGTPAAAVVILCAVEVAAGAACTGVLYGGVAMTLTVVAHDTVEAIDGRIEVWTLTASVPTGAQTVTVQGATANAKFATCCTVTATGGAASVDTFGAVDNTGGGSPLVTLTTSATTLTYGGAWSGENAATLTPRTGCTALHSDPFSGANSAYTGRRTSPDAAGSVPFGFQAGSEDFGIAAVAFKEGAAATVVTAAAALAATGNIAATGVVVRARSVTVTATAAVASTGTVTGAGVHTRTAALAAAGAIAVSGAVVDVVLPPGPAPTGRFLVAFDDATLAPYPDWTRIDAYPSLLTSYTIDRGRSYELDRTDVGRATVQISDTEGILDPTNVDGPFFGQIEPLLQATIGRWNPITEEWVTRFRGFIEEMDYSFDPSQQVNRLTVTLIDVFEILNAVKMWPGEFGDPPSEASAGQVFFDNAHADDRIIQVLGNVGVPPEFYVCFSLNVWLFEAVYSPGESAMTAIQEAADADFPGVANVFTDRFGRLAIHGRHSKFDPVGVASGASEGAWDFHQWHAGDGAAVNANPATTAHIRRFAVNRGLAKVINSALATPMGVADADVEGQVVKDTTSISRFGIRSWEAQNLLTESGLASGNTALEETKLFAEYYVANYSLPRNRVTEIGFRSMRPGTPGSAETWRLMSLVDVSDTITVTVQSPGGGGLEAEPYFVEGVHEECHPLNPDYDDVTVRLDLSPRAYFTVDPWEFP